MRWVTLLSILMLGCGSGSDPLICKDISFDDDKLCAGMDEFEIHEDDDGITLEECNYYCARDPETGECGGYTILIAISDAISDPDDKLISHFPAFLLPGGGKTAACYDPEHDVTVSVKVPDESGVAGNDDTGSVKLP